MDQTEKSHSSFHSHDKKDYQQAKEGVKPYMPPLVNKSKQYLKHMFSNTLDTPVWSTHAVYEREGSDGVVTFERRWLV